MSKSVRTAYPIQNAFKGSFKRNHEGDYHCTEQVVREMIRDASEAGNDGMLIENYGMDDIDIDTLHSYRRIFEIRNHDHVFNDYNDKEFLRNLRKFTTERTDGKEGLTVAGLLMFGMGLSVRDRYDNFRYLYLQNIPTIGTDEGN